MIYDNKIIDYINFIMRAGDFEDCSTEKVYYLYYIQTQCVRVFTTVFLKGILNFIPVSLIAFYLYILQCILTYVFGKQTHNFNIIQL